MLPKLSDGLRLDVQRLEELARLLGDVVVNEIGYAEPFHVRPLETGQVDSALDQGWKGGRVVGRASDQNPGVRKQSTLQEIGSVAERSSTAHALVVAIQDEEHAILHEVQGAPHLGDRITQRSRSREQFSRQVSQDGTAA